MPTNAELKTLVNTDIRSKTLAHSILKGKVADAIDAGYDYTDQEITALIESLQPPYSVYRAKIVKTGTGGSATFAFVVAENTTGKTLVCNNSGGSNAVINSSDTSDFLTNKSFVRISDNNYLNTVLIKHSIDSLNQISIYSYFNDSGNINFTDDLDVELIIYPD